LAGDVRVTGDGTPESDVDWYRLPPLREASVITVVTGSGIRGIELRVDGEARAVPMEADPDGVTLRSPPLEPGHEHALRVFTEGGEYAFRVQGLPEAAPVPSTAGPSVALDAPSVEVAAFWPSGQRIAGTMTVKAEDGGSGPLRLDATTSDDRWSVVLSTAEVTAQAGAEAAVPLEVLVPRDVAADRPVRVTVRARAPDGASGTAHIDVTPDREAGPLAPYRAWSVPDQLLGGLDLASPALGAVVLGSVDPDGEAALHDGFAPTDGGLWGPIGGLPLELMVDLAGDGPVPIAGTILNAMSEDPRFRHAPDAFELELSLDGVDWGPALSGSLERAIGDQAFVLPEPVDARFARLRILSTHGEDASRISLGEWKVVAQPGTPSPLEPVDLAEPARGGHVAWTEPQLGRIELATSLIDEDATVLEAVAAEPRTALSWVVGFHEGRAARITSMEWTDPGATDPALRFERLDVAISEDGPLGPYREVGAWELERAADGSVTPFVLDAPTWARFVRFTTEPTSKTARSIELPAALRILEAPTDEGYRSILGQWGLGERAGPLEASSELAAGIADDPDDDSREHPRDLALETEATGRARLGEDADWYAVAIPDGQHSMRAVVEGDPYVGVELVLHAPDGTEVPMAFGTGEQPGSVLYSATVEPGTAYLLEVRQPPSSVIVTFDTSASVGPYLDAILGSLRGFGASVIPGREAVRILPFDSEPLLAGWNDQPFEIQAAAATYQLKESSSGAEEGLRRAATDLEPRRGARAVLIVTDAASSSYRSTTELWDALAAVRPLVFAVQIGGLNEAPAGERHHLMTDWAASAGGVYRYASSDADIEEAFDHLATWLRRPAGYRVTVTTSPEELAPPEPGSLAVAAPAGASGDAGAVLAGSASVGLILDTSGTMLDRAGGERRIDVAKRVLVELVGRDLPAGMPVGLWTFARGCHPEPLVPLGPLDPPAMVDAIAGHVVHRRTPTPLAATIEQVGRDLAVVGGPHVVVVLTDGARDNCDGDPAAVVQALRDSGIDVRVNVVGFTLGRGQDRQAAARLAELGGGAYFDARRASDLAAALRAAVSAPFRVLDESGDVVAAGTVGGTPVTLPTGTYVVEVEVDPEVRYDEVYVAPGGRLELTLPSAEEPAAPE
jgi:hypothetical protein